MTRLRLAAIVAALFTSAAAFAACGGRIGDVSETTPQPSTTTTAKLPDAGTPKATDAGPDVVMMPMPDAGKPKPSKPPRDAGIDAYVPPVPDAGSTDPPFVDPGCPDAGPPKTEYECDLSPNVDESCGPGYACYPFVNYPEDPCEQEIYGSSCVAEGTGQQGDFCDAGCAKNHICVITGQGTQCVEMCDLTKPNPCSDGLVCESVDIPGIGGCI